MDYTLKHIIVQELPDAPESFIHLDMVFTFLDKNKCMVYEPVILEPNKYRTVHIKIDNGKVTINTTANLLVVLKELGIDLEPVFCGGQADPWTQEREQWHSGANFFAMAPGKVIGYARNSYTMDEMDKHGFDILRAKDVLSNKVDLNQYKKYVVTIDGSELARGGGGARCMSMPVRRKPVGW
jgi:arginine deiminase